MESINVKSVTDIINTDYKSYAIYVLENRAIPSYIDGLKPVHRKLLYSMLKQFNSKKIKVAELGSSLPSHNYHHGESSAMGAAVTLTSEWNNNVPIFRGYGNFGSRLIQEAAAPRYIYCDLNPLFSKYFTDFSVCNKHTDPDNPEPQQYLPIIPWVLVNGIEGIAVGFSCRFLSHSTKDIAKACIKAVKNKLKDDYCIPVTLPGFKGEIIQDTKDRIITRGIIERTKRNTWTITEVPWGFDREKFFVLLDKLSDQGKIQDFEDQCDDSGFKFVVKMDGKQDEKCSEDPIAYFKLERPITENYTALDEQGKIVLFDNKAQIINRFVEFRINKVSERLKYDIVDLNKKLNWLTNKQLFIKDVVDNNIVLKNATKSDLLNICSERYSVDNELANRLISTPVYDMTSDMVIELQGKIESIISDINVLENSDPKDIYLEMLKAI